MAQPRQQFADRQLVGGDLIRPGRGQGVLTRRQSELGGLFTAARPGERPGRLELDTVQLVIGDSGRPQLLDQGDQVVRVRGPAEVVALRPERVDHPDPVETPLPFKLGPVLGRGRSQQRQVGLGHVGEAGHSGRLLDRPAQAPLASPEGTRQVVPAQPADFDGPSGRSHRAHGVADPAALAGTVEPVARRGRVGTGRNEQRRGLRVTEIQRDVEVAQRPARVQPAPPPTIARPGVEGCGEAIRLGPQRLRQHGHVRPGRSQRLRGEHPDGVAHGPLTQTGPLDPIQQQRGTRKEAQPVAVIVHHAGQVGQAVLQQVEPEREVPGHRGRGEQFAGGGHPFVAARPDLVAAPLEVLLCGLQLSVLEQRDEQVGEQALRFRQAGPSRGQGGAAAIDRPFRASEHQLRGGQPARRTDLTIGMGVARRGLEPRSELFQVVDVAEVFRRGEPALRRGGEPQALAPVQVLHRREARLDLVAADRGVLHQGVEDPLEQPGKVDVVRAAHHEREARRITQMPLQRPGERGDLGLRVGRAGGGLGQAAAQLVQRVLVPRLLRDQDRAPEQRHLASLTRGHCDPCVEVVQFGWAGRAHRSSSVIDRASRSSSPRLSRLRSAGCSGRWAASTAWQ